MQPDLHQTEQLVRHAFGGLVDDAGVPQADHCMRVAQYVEVQDWLHQTVAWLHDIIEDTHVNRAYLKLGGYPDEVLEALDLLTHDKKEMDYPTYIDRICTSGDKVAIRVKLADQRDNLDPKRWLHLNKYKANALRKKYSGVQEKLECALRH